MFWWEISNTSLYALFSFGVRWEFGGGGGVKEDDWKYSRVGRERTAAPPSLSEVSSRSGNGFEGDA
jgi:hypothetical protein